MAIVSSDSISGSTESQQHKPSNVLKLGTTDRVQLDLEVTRPTSAGSNIIAATSYHTKNTNPVIIYLYSTGTESDSASAMDDEDSVSDIEGHKYLAQQLPKAEEQPDDTTMTATDQGEWALLILCFLNNNNSKVEKEGEESHASDGVSGRQLTDWKSPTMWIITENNM